MLGILFVALAPAAEAFRVAAYLPDGDTKAQILMSLRPRRRTLFLVGTEPEGDIVHKERIPRTELLNEARVARERHGAKLDVLW